MLERMVIVAGEAENGAIAVKYFELLPDIVTMDITIPEIMAWMH